MAQHVTVIGAQWGDEGKGKIVDYLSARADVVVRFQGGHNAGHTLVIDGVIYKLSLLPSGIVRPGKVAVIGNGVVVDPTALLDEMDRVQAQGVDITPKRLMIAENAPLILPLHSALDQAAETTRGSGKIGTTGRGIGPAYEDKVGRRVLRMCDLLDEAVLQARLEALVAHHNVLRRGVEMVPLEVAPILTKLKEQAERLKPFIRPVWRDLHRFSSEGKHLLFEGAQGVLLDNDWGTYPFVTSSNTVAGQAMVGSGLGSVAPRVLGIVKAYTTRVGSGPFPTEQENDIGQRLGERGHEFGTVTGRKRRCGWLDAVLLRQSVMLSGITDLVLTKLDVMDGLKTIKLCVGYEHEGQAYDYLPASLEMQANVTPIYEEMPGWQESTAGVRRMEDLPEAAQAYVRRIEALSGAQMALVSTSPEREDTITLHDLFD